MLVAVCVCVCAFVCCPPNSKLHDECESIAPLCDMNVASRKASVFLQTATILPKLCFD